MIGQALGQLLNPEGFFTIKPRLDPICPPGWALFWPTAPGVIMINAFRCSMNWACAAAGCMGSWPQSCPRPMSTAKKAFCTFMPAPKILRRILAALSRSGLPGIKTRTLSPAELNSEEPHLAPDLAGAIWYQNDAMLRPESFLASLAKGVREAERAHPNRGGGV